MNTWYCTVCGLGFGFRTELAWHVRENHLSHPQEWAKLASHGVSRGVAWDWARLHELQSVVDYPAISLLMGTIPSPTMTPLAAARLRLLAQQARCRLLQELHGRALPEIEERLTRAVAVAERGATDDGLAVFVSPHHVAVVPLPFRPHERVIVDTMFATRDVLDALQRYPGYRVLVLGTACFRILEGRARHLKEVAAWQAPTVLPGWMLPKPEAGHTDPDGHINLRERPELVLSEADRALDKRVGLEGPLPLIVAGQHRFLVRFERHSAHSASVVGEVRVLGSTASLQAVAALAEPLIGAWCAQNASRALDALGQADRDGKVAWGLDGVWHALLAGRIEHLWVEREFAVAARVAKGGETLTLTDDRGQPGVTDDVVDEIIELATARGAPVEVVDLISSHEGHIAAQLRDPARVC